jgi:CBS domain-containing protein
MNVGTICSREVVVCHREASALDAARLIRHHHVGDLIVVEGPAEHQTPVGIVTDRDIVVAIVAKEIDAASMLVVDIMSGSPVTVYEWEDAWQAVRRMRLHAVRRMPVVNDDGELVGIVALDDVLAACAALMTEMAQVSARERAFEEKSRH